MKLIIVSTLLILTLGCTKRPIELSDKCKQIIESNYFYYAVPLANTVHTAWKLDNFLIASSDPNIQTFDSDCVVTISPTFEKFDELQRVLADNFDETVSIAIKHTQATKCVAESNGLQFLEATGQLIRFKSTNQTWDLDMRKDKFADWKFILFRKGKEPKVVPNVIMTFDLMDEYFGTTTTASL